MSKDIPDNSVAAGIPCKVIGDFNDLVEKRELVQSVSVDELWEEFYGNHTI